MWEWVPSQRQSRFENVLRSLVSITLKNKKKKKEEEEGKEEKKKERKGSLFKGSYYFKTHWTQVEISGKQFRDRSKSPQDGWQGRI